MRTRFAFILIVTCAVTALIVASYQPATQAQTSPPTFLLAWGTEGSGEGQFRGQTDVAVDAVGNVYVADTANDRVQKFTGNGVFLIAWGAEGEGPGQFERPLGIAVDMDGNVYVADSGNRRIQKFTGDGAFVTMWGEYGNGDGQFIHVQSVAVDPTGNVYAIDSGNPYSVNLATQRIHKFTSDGDFLATWLIESGGGRPSGQPWDVAADMAGNVYVTHSITVLTSDPTRNFYVTSAWDSHVLKYSSDGAYLRSWGEYGSREGQFTNPYGIAVDTLGDVYVVDAGNHRIQRFTSDGAFLAAWAMETRGERPFVSLAGSGGIAVDAAGNVYVSDGANDRIQKFGIAPPAATPVTPIPTGARANGTATPPAFLLAWGESETGEGQFRHPYDIAVDAAGDIYMVNPWHNRIHKFTNNGAFLFAWGSEGDREGQFRFSNEFWMLLFIPSSGISVDAVGDVYVADTGNGRIQKFTSDGAFLTAWGTRGSGEGQFSYPTGVAVDAAGNVYVADTSNQRIQKFTSDGAFLAAWGSEGDGEGQFFDPWGIAVDAAGNVYVADTGNRRIQKFTNDGAFLSAWGTRGSGLGQFSRLRGITVDTAGNIYVVDAGNHRIQEFTRDGAFLNAWGTEGNGDGQFLQPWGIAVDAAGNVYVSDAARHQILKFGTTTQPGSEPLPASVRAPRVAE